MARFCANCGTEVDENAVFCPTCGQPIDQEVEAQMPPAPSWPDPEPAAPAAEASLEPEPEPEVAEPRSSADREADDDLEDPEATRVEARPAPQPEPAEPEPQTAPPSNAEPPRGAPPSAESRSATPAMELPITTPVTLSGWLIGVGTALGALGALIALFDGLGTAIDLLLLVSLLAVAATVFLSDRLPHVPQLRLITLAVVAVAFGVALDRLGLGRAGAGELLLFLGVAAAIIGAILLESGQDQPLGGPSA